MVGTSNQSVPEMAIELFNRIFPYKPLFVWFSYGFPMVWGIPFKRLRLQNTLAFEHCL